MLLAQAVSLDLDSGPTGADNRDTPCQFVKRRENANLHAPLSLLCNI